MDVTAYCEDWPYFFYIFKVPNIQEVPNNINIDLSLLRETQCK